MSDDPLIGRQLANFKVERTLGRGGMAQVYFGRDVSLERPVAIKVIDARFRGDPAYAERFVKEARLIATWRHENIIQVFYADDEDGLYYFVMEYIDGLSLDDLIKAYVDDGELMPQEDVVRIGRAIASALDYAATHDVIHRDVKPSNVMIASDNRVVLADFGLALDTQQGSMGEILGTPHYVAPEQAMNSANAVAQSDLYALGIILYEMLAGQVPFDDPSFGAVITQHINQPPPDPQTVNPRLNDDTHDVLLKALEKAPEDRYQTGAELMDALESALNLNPEPEKPSVLAPAERSMSRMSALDKIEKSQATAPASPRSRTAPAQPKATQAPTPPPQPTTVQPESRGRGGLLMGAALLVVVAIVVAGALILPGLGSDDSGSDGDDVVPTLMSTDVAAAAVTDEPTEAPTDAPTEVPTDVPTEAPTDIPTELPTEEPTDAPTEVPTDMPTTVPTNTPLPTFTPTPTDIPATATPEPTATTALIEPTVAFPDGPLVRFMYNDSSFYIHNLTPDSLRISEFGFQAMDADGNGLAYTFQGNRWSAFFRLLESGKCNAIEITQASNVMFPASCAAYNARVTLRSGDGELFWIERPGVVTFRVFFGNFEVGRCDIGANECEVRLPS